MKRMYICLFIILLCLSFGCSKNPLDSSEINVLNNEEDIIIQDVPNKPYIIKTEVTFEYPTNQMYLLIKLFWTDVSDNEDGFVIYREGIGNVSETYPLRQLDEVSANSVLYFDKSLRMENFDNVLKGEYFQYNIFSFNEIGLSNSETVIVKIDY